MQKLPETGEVHSLPSTVVQKLEEAGIPQDSLIFYKNSRWVYQKGQPLLNNNQFRCQPIDSLGPFGIHPVDVSFILYPETHTYKIIKIGNRQLTGEEQATGVFAPIAQITLEGFARSTANIPENATHFCWLYPPTTNLIHHHITLGTIHESNLLKIGGFAYFHLDQNNESPLQLVRVNSLIVPATNGLIFKGSFPWPKEFTNNLWKNNRFHPVTLPYLIQSGARYFAFINPSESVSDENGQSPWIPSEHGAFIYLFNEDHSPHSFDCYFSVADECLGVAPSGEH